MLLSGLARQFTVKGEPSDLIAYRREAAALKAVEERTRRIRDAGAAQTELDNLHEALRWADALQGQQVEAIAAKERGDDETAIRIVFSPEYERELNRSMTAVQRFQEELDRRSEGVVRAAIERSALWRFTSEVMLAITALLFLFVLYFIFRKRVLHPVVKLSDIVARLATQDFAAEPPSFGHIDEIGDMAQALRVFRENGIERQRLERERDVDRTMRELLSRMTQRMQGCDDVADLTRVIQRFVPEVAPHLAGRLYLVDQERGAVVEAGSWLAPQNSRSEFSPLSCWALRRGTAHCATGEHIDVPCEHLLDGGPAAPGSICLPLTGQNGLLGLLYLERRPEAHGAQHAGETGVALSNMYVTLLAENVGLALDNLRLRDALRALARVDPLTQLANRRELDRELERQLGDAERAGAVVSCAMVDIDHFKRFNDEHGHDAGDAVLREVAAVLKRSVREEGALFRYGGEEFLILLTGVDAASAFVRAEQIRLAIAELSLRFEGRSIGPVTASVGVATAPLHCDWQKLVQTADAALLSAKRAGRDRVLTAAVGPSPQAVG